MVETIVPEGGPEDLPVRSRPAGLRRRGRKPVARARNVCRRCPTRAAGRSRSITATKTCSSSSASRRRPTGRSSCASRSTATFWCARTATTTGSSASGPGFPSRRSASQYYTFHALVRVKKPFVPFAPGATIRRVAEGDDNVLETRVDKPVQFAAILAGKYEIEEADQERRHDSRGDVCHEQPARREAAGGPRRFDHRRSTRSFWGRFLSRSSTSSRSTHSASGRRRPG